MLCCRCIRKLYWVLSSALIFIQSSSAPRSLLHPFPPPLFQVQPSDRASIAELCLDPWVTAHGPVPPDTGGEALHCGECEPSTQTSASWTFARIRGLAVRRWRPAALALLYAGMLVGGASLHAWGGGKDRPIGKGGVSQDFGVNGGWGWGEVPQPRHRTGRQARTRR